VGECTPPSAYLVVCAKLRPFGAFQFSPKLPLLAAAVLRCARVCVYVVVRMCKREGVSGERALLKITHAAAVGSQG